jgi:hypothetical protein
VGVGVVVEAVALDPAGHVHVGDPLQGQGVQEGERVAAVVAGVGVQVGHVQQQPGAGPLQQLGQEGGLVQLGRRPLQQGGHVL